MTFLAVQTLSSHAGEYPIGGVLPGDQDFPAASISADGGYLTWEDNRIEGSKHGSGIAALGLDSNLTATGSVFRVNQQPIGNQEKPQVLRLSNGSTLFAWEQRQAGKPGVYARLLDANGRFATSDVLVNTPSLPRSIIISTNWYAFSRNAFKLRRYKFREKTLNIREQAGGVALAALPDGGALVAYHAMRKAETNTWGIVTNEIVVGSRFVTKTRLQPYLFLGDWMHDVFFQRLDSAGKKVGLEVMVNQYDSYNQRNPAVAVLSDGRLAVVWVSEFPVSANWRHNFRVALYGRLFSAQGEPAGDEFSIAAGEELIQANPSVAALLGGGFTVLWSQQEGTASRQWDVYGRSFGAEGTATGSAFRINDYTTGDQFAPKVASFGDEQLVVWTSVGQDGAREGVYGRFLTAGALTGEEFRVNTTTVSRQMHPAVAVDGDGRFLNVWAGFGGETGLDLYGQQFSQTTGGTTSAQNFRMKSNYAVNYLADVVAGRIPPPIPPTPLTPGRETPLPHLPNGP